MLVINVLTAPATVRKAIVSLDIEVTSRDDERIAFDKDLHSLPHHPAKDLIEDLFTGSLLESI